MTEEEKNLIRDTLRSPGWLILKKRNEVSIDGYRSLATRAPGESTSEMRTWFSGKAEGRAEFVEEAERRAVDKPLAESE